LSRFKSNLIANFAGAGWSALLGLVCTPLYIRFMGIEAYGLVGFYIMLQTSLLVLDMGLSPTMNREMARYSVQPDKAGEIRDFVLTLGTCSWGMGLMIGATLVATAPLIAAHWIKASAIPGSEVRSAVSMMGILVALQWPISSFQGGLMGLQRQVLVNGLRIAMITLGHGGALLILWRISPAVTAYFGWQILVSAVQAILSMAILWRRLPLSDQPPRFRPVMIRSVWRFAAGMSGITVSALLLTQLDKVILSKMLSLEMFGYYTLAGVVSGGLYVLISPVFNATFPKFSALAAAGDEDGTRRLYHQSTQLMAVLVLPVAILVALFSFDLVLLWIGNVGTARHVSPIISTLIVGTALNGLMNPPFALQLANGWTQIGNRINAFLIVLLVPATVYLTNRYGAIGGASVWVILNSVYIGIGIPLTHRRLLKGEASLWLKSVALPLIATTLVVGAGRIVIGSPLAPLVAICALPLLLACALAAAVLVAPQIRTILFAQIASHIAPGR
jgi:O-antigen/teichoic acid export membrane protein